MPPRLSKRQQRELEEIQTLTAVKPDPSISSEEDEAISSSHLQSSGGFSALFVADDDPSEEEEKETKAGKPRKSKKKKKKSVQTATSVVDVSADKETSRDTPRPTPVPTLVAARNEKKAAKKARAKEKKAADDELDQALAELSIQYPTSQKISNSVEGRPSLTELLSVSLQFLDADAEMRRFFGSKVVLASKSGESSRAKRPQGIRSNMTRPQPTWGMVKGREGLSLRSYTDDEVAEKLSRQGWSPIEEKWWTVEYSKRYKSMTWAFMSAVMAGDPQGLFDLLGVFPWHADTLLQIAEVNRHREEHAQAVDFVDRALFTYERCLMGVFNLTTGLNRLDFDQVENRPFFLALHRQVADLQRRGCVRTSFEFAKLLYGLDPWNDPHGAIFHLEYLAIKAGMHQWLLHAYDVFEDLWSKNSSEKPDTRLNPSLLPGWAYSRALAMKIMEDNTKQKDHTKSSAALQQAAHDFPSIVPLLADKLDVSLPGKLRSHHDFKIETDAQSLSEAASTLHLLSHLYVQRSLPVWKDHASWFSATITEAFSVLPSSLPVKERKRAFLSAYGNLNLRYSVYRHVFVLESSYRRLFSFIPRQVFEGKAVACDPLPPPTSVNYYDQDFFRGAEDLFSERRGRRRRMVDQRFLEQLLPDPAVRQQLQHAFDALPHLAQRFPGGVAEFAQMAAHMQPDLVEDMMIEALNVQGGMPGGLDAVVAEEEAVLPDNVVEVNFNPAPRENQQIAAVQRQRRGEEEADDDDEEEEEDEEDDDEDISPMPRALRNILGRLFGRSMVVSESSSEDEVAPLDDTGVD